MRVLGFDPDLHNAGLAIIEDARGPRSVGPLLVVRLLHVVQVDKNLKGDQAVRAMVAALPHRSPHDDRVIVRTVNGWDGFDYRHAIVEGQESYRGKGNGASTPDVLIRLAHVAGAAAREYAGTIVAPKVWKGSIPKEVKQARICSRLGWTYEVRAGWVEPTGAGPAAFPHIKGKQWSHVVDAIGLALWKIEQLTA